MICTSEIVSHKRVSQNSLLFLIFPVVRQSQQSTWNTRTVYFSNTLAMIEINDEFSEYHSSSGTTVYRFETEISGPASTRLFNSMQYADALVIGFRGHGAWVEVLPLGTKIGFPLTTNKVQLRPYCQYFAINVISILWPQFQRDIATMY